MYAALGMRLLLPGMGLSASCHQVAVKGLLSAFYIPPLFSALRSVSAGWLVGPAVLVRVVRVCELSARNPLLALYSLVSLIPIFILLYISHFEIPIVSCAIPLSSHSLLLSLPSQPCITKARLSITVSYTLQMANLKPSVTTSTVAAAVAAAAADADEFWIFGYG